MKFVAKFLDIHSLQTFTKHLSDLCSPLWKFSILMFTPTKIIFITQDNNHKSTISIHFEFEKSSLCNFYKIQGKDDRNYILLDVSASTFAGIMKNCVCANQIKLKLVKRQLPMLIFEIMLCDNQKSGIIRTVEHFVPAHIISMKVWNNYILSYPDSNHQLTIQICKPEKLKQILDSLRNISTFANFSLKNNVNMLQIKAKSDDMMAYLSLCGDITENSICSSTNETSITIDSRKMFHFLLNHQQHIQQSSMHITIYHDTAIYMTILSPTSKLIFKQSAMVVETTF